MFNKTEKFNQAVASRGARTPSKTSPSIANWISETKDHALKQGFASVQAWLRANNMQNASTLWSIWAYKGQTPNIKTYNLIEDIKKWDNTI